MIIGLLGIICTSYLVIEYRKEKNINPVSAALKSKFIYMFKIFLISALIFQKIKKIFLSLFFKKYRTSCFSSS